MEKQYFCVACGCEVPAQRDEELQPLLRCPSCGACFSTPEHEYRYRTTMSLQGSLTDGRFRAVPQDADGCDDGYDDEDDGYDDRPEYRRPSLLRRAAGAAGFFFLGLTGRLVLFATGWAVLVLGLPLVFQYGFLRTLYPKIYSLYSTIPLAGKLYPPQLSASGISLTGQLLTALLLAAGLVLIRQRRR